MSSIVLFDDKKDCCGCGACMNVCPKNAIRMAEDEVGFVYPEIDQNLCIGCGACKKACGYQMQPMMQKSEAVYAGQYLSTKEVQQQFTKAIFKKKFRAEHSKELDAYVESVKYFREENDGKLPSLKSLKKRKEELTKEIAERKKVYTPLKEESRRLEVASDNVYSIFRKTNEMKSDLAWKREWEARVREKARQEQVRQEQRVRQPKRKKRSYDVSL